MSDADIVTHVEPAWRSRSDFVFHAQFWADEDGRGEPMLEQLWGREVSTNKLELCCIPFFIYDLNLGDVVTIDDANMLLRREMDNGHYTYRTWFRDRSVSQSGVVRKANAMGILVEWNLDRYLAFDAPDLETGKRFSLYLQKLEDAGELEYETGRTVLPDP